MQFLQTWTETFVAHLEPTRLYILKCKLTAGINRVKYFLTFALYRSVNSYAVILKYYTAQKVSSELSSYSLVTSTQIIMRIRQCYLIHRPMLSTSHALGNVRKKVVIAFTADKAVFCFCELSAKAVQYLICWIQLNWSITAETVQSQQSKEIIPRVAIKFWQTLIPSLF